MLVQSREWVSAVGGAPRALVSPGTYARRTEARLKQGYERRRFGLAGALSWCSSRLPGCAGFEAPGGREGPGVLGPSRIDPPTTGGSVVRLPGSCRAARACRRWRWR